MTVPPPQQRWPNDPPPPVVETPGGPARPAAEPASLWEDFLDIFYAPRQVFERRREGKFGLAMLILVALGIAIFFMSRPVLEPVYDAMVDMMIAQAAKQNPGMKVEDLERGRGMMSTGLTFSMLFMFPIIILLTGTTLWLVGKLFDSTQRFGQAMMVATYANVPRLLLSILVLVLALAFGTDNMTSQFALTMSPARFMSPDATPLWLLTALSRLDIFTLWVTALLGLGLHVTGKIGLGKAMAAAFIVWLLGGLVLIAQAAQAG